MSLALRTRTPHAECANRFAFVPHRKLPFPNGRIALLAEQSTAWCMLSLKDYLVLTHVLPILDETLLEQKPGLRRTIDGLWQAGVLLQDGAPLPRSVRPEKKLPSSVLLKLTGACNIQCEYCYDYDTSRWRSRLSLTRIVETLNSLLEQRDDLGVAFHGGEPLLQFGLIKEVVAHLDTWKSRGKNIALSIQTNATLFSPEVISFLQDKHFSVGISLDSHTEEGNVLRKHRTAKSPLQYVRGLLDSHGDFVRNQCGFLAVVNRTSASGIHDFAFWLQDQGISSLTFSFMDLTGKGAALQDEKLSPDRAVEVFMTFLDHIRTGAIDALDLKSITSRMENFFSFVPRDYCHKGPCAAADDFLVLDATGRYRTCDCVYDSFFEMDEKEGIGAASSARKRVTDRHHWLKTSTETECSRCALFGLCGGTCVAKAIASSGTPNAVNDIECTLAKAVYPVFLEEFSDSDNSPLFQYYRRHNASKFQ